MYLGYGKRRVAAPDPEFTQVGQETAMGELLRRARPRSNDASPQSRPRVPAPRNSAPLPYACNARPL